MIADLTLRWLVTILFALSALEIVYAMFTRRHRWVDIVGNSLHLVMAVAMGVMAWPRGAELPTTGPMVFFLLAAVWFAVIAATPIGARHRVADGYHGLMMLAMAWMYAVMNGRVLPGQSAGSGDGSAHGHHSGHAGMPVPGADMPGSGMAGTDTSGMPGMDMSAGYPAWIDVIDWIWTLGFAAAALFWIYRAFLSRRASTDELSHGRLGALSQAMMAAGMAIMFGVML